MAIELAAGYYLDNFNYLLNFVGQHYDHLLNDDEKTYARTFNRLDIDAKRLYVRLLGRKGPLFRLDKLHYDDINDIELAAQILETNGLLQFSPLVASEHYLALLVKSEIGKLFSIEVKQHRRPVLDSLVLERWHAEEIRALLPFPVVVLQGQEVLLMFRLLFFGNLYQDLTEFVLRDLGVTPFEQYVFDAKYTGFRSRTQLDATYQAYVLADQAYEIIETGDAGALLAFASDELLALSVNDDLAIDSALQRRYSRTYNLVARQLERYQTFDMALRLYEQSNRTPSRERRARIYATNGQAEQALLLCREIIAAPWDEAEQDFALGFARRTAKKFDLGSEGFDLPNHVSIETLEIELEEYGGLSVETLVANWYQNGGHRAGKHEAYFVENGLLNGLFGLLFWDIIFTPVEGAFFNPFQRGPADIFTPAFYMARAEPINERLAQLEDTGGEICAEPIAKRIRETFAAKLNISNYFVNWRRIDAHIIDTALTRIPAAHLLTIFKRMFKDLRANTSGLPDLVVFPEAAGYSLVEVKGPGDKLQKNQTRWFNVFNQAGIPNQLVKVRFVEQP